MNSSNNVGSAAIHLTTLHKKNAERVKQDVEEYTKETIGERTVILAESEFYPFRITVKGVTEQESMVLDKIFLRHSYIKDFLPGDEDNKEDFFIFVEGI